VHADATSWDDNKKLFAVAEEQFGGVDVSICALVVGRLASAYPCYLKIACMNAGIGQAPDTIFSPLEGK
jgi:hypothetical protein